MERTGTYNGYQYQAWAHRYRAPVCWKPAGWVLTGVNHLGQNVYHRWDAATGPSCPTEETALNHQVELMKRWIDENLPQRAT